MRANIHSGGSDNSASQDFTLRRSGYLIAVLTQMSILCLNKLVIKVSFVDDFLKKEKIATILLDQRTLQASVFSEHLSECRQE